MEGLSFGDWVVYDPGYGESRIGRVTEVRGDNAFVCYSSGCAAASTPLIYLRAASAEEVDGADASIGFHRFDATCPERDEACCYGCRAKAVE